MLVGLYPGIGFIALTPPKGNNLQIVWLKARLENFNETIYFKVFLYTLKLTDEKYIYKFLLSFFTSCLATGNLCIFPAPKHLSAPLFLSRGVTSPETMPLVALLRRRDTTSMPRTAASAGEPPGTAAQGDSWSLNTQSNSHLSYQKMTGKYQNRDMKSER